MKVNEFRDLTPEELVSKLAALKGELFNLRFQLATNQLENTNKICETKRNIAKCKTVICEREMASVKK